ncbi:MAG: hypothetical protein VB027_10360 [Gordonibacter sp.]|nr:hypothetical protein [Gordonibacter sp.]
MKEKIEDIRRAMEAGAYQSALCLALTLPDICAIVQYGKDERVGERYAAWCNEHVIPRYFPDYNKMEKDDVDYPVFDGRACYMLRCKVLHESNVSIDCEKNILIDQFDLCATNAGMDELGFAVSMGTDVDVYANGEHRKGNTMTIDISYLCSSLGQAAIEFYAKHDNKQAFEGHTIVFRKL